MADWYTTLQCDTNLQIRSKNKAGKFQAVNGNLFTVSKKDSVIMKGFSEEGKHLLTIYPWEGIHYSVPKAVKVKVLKTDKDSFLELEVVSSTKMYHISCRKDYK